MNLWYERPPACPADCGDVGGDEQAGVAWGRSWYRPRWTAARGWHYEMLTSYHYSCADLPRPPWVTHQLEYLVYTDPRDPGGSEVCSDYRYEDLSEPATDERARALCVQATPGPLADRFVG